MRSIRHGISTSRHANAHLPRYKAGTSFVAVTPLPTAPSASRETKGKASEWHSEDQDALRECASEEKVGSTRAVSEFEAITRPYDHEDHRPPEAKRMELQPPPKSMIRRIEDSQGNSRLPPVPLCDRRKRRWRNEAWGNNDLRRLTFETTHTPLPLTFGSGAVEGRVKRYQQVLRQRENISQAVVEALGRSSDELGLELPDAGATNEAVAKGTKASLFPEFPSETTGKPSVSSFLSHERAAKSNLPKNSFLEHHSSRRYSSSICAGGSSDAQEVHASFALASLGDSVSQKGAVSSGDLHDATIHHAGAPNQKVASEIGEVGTGWLGEEWKDDWGEDQLAPPPSRGDHMGSSNLRLQSSVSRYLASIEKQRMPPRIPRRTVRRYPSSLSTLLLKMLERKKDVVQRDTSSEQPIPMDVGLQPTVKDMDRVRTIQETNAPVSSDVMARLRTASRSVASNKRSKFIPPKLRIPSVSALPDSSILCPHAETFSERAAISKDGKVELPLSKNARKIGALALKKQGVLEIMFGKAALKRKGTKAKLKKKRGEAQQTAMKGVLKPLALSTEVLEDVEPPYEPRAVPRLAHGLDRVLFNPSVHWVQDPHSRVYNFPPNLQALPAVTEFAFERLGPYISSSHDESLRWLAVQHCKRFVGSTSSLTGFLSHIYFLISGDRPVDISNLSMAFRDESRTFTPGIRLPAQVVFHHHQYQVDVEGQPISTSTIGSRKNSESNDQGDSLNSAQPGSPSRATTQSSVTGLEDASLMQTNAEDIPNDVLLDSVCNHLSEDVDRHDRAVSEPLQVKPHLLDGDGLPAPCLGSPLPDDAPSTTNQGPEDISTTTKCSEKLPNLQITSPCNSGTSDVTTDDRPESNRLFDMYSIDHGTGDSADSRMDELNVLLWLGTMAEKFLTLSEPAFAALLRKNPATDAAPKRNESYRYAKSSHFVMRSQLDCQDTRLPGTGVFDIKTRAVLPVRLDSLNYLNNAGYLIRKMTGLYESFEREYYDLVRSAFLKYNFQARIGNMDGVFVAYHNTVRMFGFQYVPVTEMEERIYGPGPRGRGAKIFEKCVGLLEVLCSEVVACFPSESVSCVIEAQPNAGHLKLWVWPISGPDPKPIAQLTVTVYHIMQGRRVESKIALDRANNDWKLHYTISRTFEPATTLWAAVKEVRGREFASTLPEGVTKEEMMKRLENVNFAAGIGLDVELPGEADQNETKEGETKEDGTKEKETKEDEPKSKFRKARGLIKHLRRLAKQGWADLEREGEVSAQHVVFGVDRDEGISHGAGKQPIQRSTESSLTPEHECIDSSEGQDTGSEGPFGDDVLGASGGAGAGHLERTVSTIDSREQETSPNAKD